MVDDLRIKGQDRFLVCTDDKLKGIPALDLDIEAVPGRGTACAKHCNIHQQWTGAAAQDIDI